MGARLFTAVLPPPEVVAELSRHLEPRLEAGRDDWRWTRAEGWHLTTAFMASVDDYAQEQLEAELVDAVGRLAPFDLRIEGARCFPRVERAMALAMAVTTGADQLAALARTCRSVASRVGAAPDGAAFVGHLTLGRARRPFDATRWVRIVDAFPGWTWPVTEVALIESHLADRSNRYEVVARFPLSGRAVPAGPVA